MKTGERFLHEQNPGLHTSAEVEHVVSYLQQNGERVSQKPADKLEAYLGFLAHEGLADDGLLTGNEESIHRQLESLIIDSHDVPENYFKLQQKIALEQGHGHVEFTPAQRERMVQVIRSDQRASLLRWANYLTSPTNEHSYPDWFKKYAFDSVLKLGQFDKQKAKFTKRDEHTTAPFADLNPEAVAHVLDSISKLHLKGETIDDEKLRALVKDGSFGRLYAHAILEVTPANAEERKEIRGSWIKYDQIEPGDYNSHFEQGPDGEYFDSEADKVTNETALQLSRSLQGHGTGWCTAGETTAAMQLSAGDFYVFYTRDYNGEDTVPRIAIRMSNGVVAEVRGIDASQNLEESMLDIATAKLKELPGGEAYLTIAEDLKRLTEVYNRVKDGGDLTDDEALWLRFTNISSFGQDDWVVGGGDPRVAELLLGTDPRDDVELLIQKLGKQQAYDFLIDKIDQTDGSDKTITATLAALDLFELSTESQRELLTKISVDYFAPYLLENYLDKFSPDALIGTGFLENLVRLSAYETLDKAVATVQFERSDFLELQKVLLETNDAETLIRYWDKFELSSTEVEQVIYGALDHVSFFEPSIEENINKLLPHLTADQEALVVRNMINNGQYELLERISGQLNQSEEIQNMIRYAKKI